MTINNTPQNAAPTTAPAESDALALADRIAAVLGHHTKANDPGTASGPAMSAPTDEDLAAALATVLVGLTVDVADEDPAAEDTDAEATAASPTEDGVR